VTEGWKDLLNKDLHDLRSLSNVGCVYEMKEDERRKDCGTYGGKRGTYSVLFGKRE
jgi:hypothetical protein